MADDSITVRVRGLDELKAQLQALPDKLRRRLLRNALAAGARLVRDEARRAAPVLRQPDPRRKPGTVRDAITVRTSKHARREGHVGVFVNVRPLKKEAVRQYKAGSGKSGATNPNDPFYWRWLEFGRQGRAASGPRGKGLIFVGGKQRRQRARRAMKPVGPLPAYGFLRKGAAKLGEALRRFEQVLGPGLQRILNRQAQE